jgi:glutamyl-tRNA synthetase
MITRFAPSPTGSLHLGGARTALFNWLLARRAGGRFILRIEDTDDARSTDASSEQILESLRWLGIDWDDGPFFQSARTDIYFDHLKTLEARDAIYPAFETKDELEAARQRAVSEKRTWLYDGPSRHLSRAEAHKRIAAGDQYVWRFRVPSEGKIFIPETLMNREGVNFRKADVGDFVVTRPSTYEGFGKPLYNFCCVVDDALMKITHVIRGVEHLTNTPKQMLLYEAFGYQNPTFTHLPLLMKNKKKMSKRDSEADPSYPVSVLARRDLGYLPEATINFLALLGWSHPSGEELFSIDQLKESFSVKRLVRSNANFDDDKYLHTNAWHLRRKSIGELANLIIPFLERAGFDLTSHSRIWLEQIVILHRERCRTLGEYVDALRYFFQAPSSLDSGVAERVLIDSKARQAIYELREILAALKVFDQVTIEKAVRQYAERTGLKLTEVSQPLRVALTGRTVSPGIFDVMAALGMKETLHRLDAVSSLSQRDVQ